MLTALERLCAITPTPIYTAIRIDDLSAYRLDLSACWLNSKLLRSLLVSSLKLSLSLATSFSLRIAKSSCFMGAPGFEQATAIGSL